MHQPSLFRTFLLSLLMALPAVLPAQSESEQVKAAIEDGLRTYVSDLYPPKGCPENASSHSYAGTYKITKHGSVNGTLRVFGVAKVTYRNARTGGADTIEFYAELEKENGQVVLSRLRWRRGPCMQYATLMGES